MSRDTGTRSARCGNGTGNRGRRRAGGIRASLRAAQGMDAQYTLTLSGITGGQIAIRGRDDGATYAVSSAARASGLVGSLVKYEFEGAGAGPHRRRPLRQLRLHRERGRRRRRHRLGHAFLRHHAGLRHLHTAPRPRTMGHRAYGTRGVVDPLTALYAVLQPVAPAERLPRQLRHVRRAAGFAPRLGIAAPASGRDDRLHRALRPPARLFARGHGRPAAA